MVVNGYVLPQFFSSRRTFSSIMESSSPQAPKYNKPEKPGVWLGFDNSVSIYQVVKSEDSFDEAARVAFNYLKEAEERYPSWQRIYYLDIGGHEGIDAGFDEDMSEFQQEFLIGVMGKFFTGLDLPMLSVLNPETQSNDLPDALAIGDPNTQ